MPTNSIALYTAGAVSLVIVLQQLFERITTEPAQLHSAGLSLLLGVGLSSAAAASALLGQLGLALAAASGGAFLLWVLIGAGRGGESAKHPLVTLPYVLAPSLLGLASVLFARLSWYALIPLALIPLATSLIPQKSGSRFVRALLASLPGLLIALAVAFWVWQTSASDSGY